MQKHINGQTEGWASIRQREADRQRKRYSERQMNRQTDRHKDGQALD